MLLADAGIEITPSVGERITQMICDALNAFDDKPAIAYRSRTEALSIGELPAMVVYSALENAELQSDTLRRKRTVRVEIMVAGEAPADGLIDPVYVYAVLALTKHPTLGDLVNLTQETGIEWDLEGGYEDVAIAKVDFDVVYQTEQWDPTKLFQI